MTVQVGGPPSVHIFRSDEPPVQWLTKEVLVPHEVRVPFVPRWLYAALSVETVVLAAVVLL